MLILQADGLVKTYGERVLFRSGPLSVYSGEHIGIVGRNGSGKTTLLRILLGQLEPDEGWVSLNAPFSYVGQLDKTEAGEYDPEQLALFGISEPENTETLSGGETTRLKLASAFSVQVPLLAADEPTANLDLEGVEYLTGVLRDYEGALLLISHDRFLLDEVCDRIWEISDGELNEYYGGYSEYRRQADERMARHQFEYDRYITEKGRLESSLAEARNRAGSVRKAPKRMGNSEARLHKMEGAQISGKLAGTAKNLETRIQQLEVVDKPVAHLPIRIDLSLTEPPQNRIILSADRLTFGYGERLLFDNASFEVPNLKKTALIGPNGSGKTTLLRLLMQESGRFRLAPKAKIGYFSQNFENLRPEQSILENVMRDSVQPQETVRTILARLSFRRETVNKPVGVLSGGERIKAAIARLVCSESNFLVLDEPTNYLDTESIDALQEVLRAYEGTVLMVSHDRSFVDTVADRLLILENRSFRSFEGSYSGWKSSLEITPDTARQKDALLMLEMRMSRLSAQIGTNPPDRETLVEEFDRLAEEKRRLTATR